MTYLLDINLLLALSDPLHVHHEAAHHWFGMIGRAAWATCPLTENGFVRIASHPRYPNRPGEAPIVIALLVRLRSSGGHVFWPDDVSLVDLLVPSAIITHSQITDLYLLGLAHHHGGKLATLDRRIAPSAVGTAAGALEIVAVP